MRRCISVLVLTAALAFAQYGTGSIQGTVKDASGAVVPGANITITQTQTARQFSTTTNGVGFYLFPSAAMGPYSITIEAAGMETWKQGITLMVGQAAQIDAVLKVGAAATVVTVAGDLTPMVTTTSPTLSTVVERERIEQLPVNGRSIVSLVIATTPGLENVGYTPRVYGLRYASEFLMDGAALVNRDWGGMMGRTPGLDAIQEFRVESNNSSAKMDRPGSIILSSRPGTNQLHGSLFETARNSGIGVARRRTDYYLKPPHLVRNEFGASVGGPVWMPKVYHGKNRTFFFVAYEGYRYRSGSTLGVTMPTQAMRLGDFSGLVDGQGRRYSLYDPLTTDATTWTRQPFTNNQIPVNRESPLAKYLNSVTPVPTLSDVNPLVANNWFGPGPSNTNEMTLTSRVDHRLSDRDQLFFRYSHSPSWGSSPAGLSGGPQTLDGKANAKVNEYSNDSGVASWTHTIGPTFFSETVFTVSRDYRGQLPFTGTEELATGLGLPNPFKGFGFPRIQSTGFNMDFDAGINPTINYARIFNLDENLTKVHGRHEFQFGGRFHPEYLETLADQQIQQGNILFSSQATSLYDPKSGSSYSAVPYTGHNAANLFLGYATYAAQWNRQWYNLRQWELSGYLQDNFKVNSRLTLNLGVRYEFNTPPISTDDTTIGFDPKTHAAVLQRTTNDLIRIGATIPSLVNAFANLGMQYETPDQAGLPKALAYSNKLDFGPRAGFAYRLSGSPRAVVVRGGYSIFGYPERLRSFDARTRLVPPMTGQIQNNLNSAAQSPDGLPNYLLRSVPAIVAGVNSADALDPNAVTGITRGGFSMSYTDPDQPTARAHEWNLTLEKEVYPDTVVKASYAGTHGSRMQQLYSYNGTASAYVWYVAQGIPFPTGTYANVARRLFDQQLWGNIEDIKKTGWSNDNSFQVEIQHRYSKGYAFQLYYIMNNAMRAGGEGWSDDFVYPAGMYLPGTVPDNYDAMNRFLNYKRDIDIPKHRIQWNWVADLPFGRGKSLGRNARGFLNALIGGWQIAGKGSWNTRYFQLPTSYFGPSKIEIYGKKYPIQDCRSGVCYAGYLYWNGYIPANRINSYDSAGKPNGVMGVPDSYQPFMTPLWPTPKDGGSPSDPLYSYYDTNTVWVPIKNGTVQRTTIDPGIYPMQNQFALGLSNWTMDASAFKAIQVNERMFVRFNIDFFNVFNMPGLGLPGGNGIISSQSSYNAPRNLQLTLRFTW